MFTPVDAARRLYQKLTEANVPAVLHVLPQTDHAFDLFLPERSPVAHTAFYLAERFLALMTSWSAQDRAGKDEEGRTLRIQLLQ